MSSPHNPLISLIPLFVVVGIIGVALRGTYRHAAKFPSAQNGSLSGVAGWLLFLTVTLMIGPVLATASTFGDFGYEEFKNNALRGNVAWANFKFAVMTLYVVVTVLSVFAGICLVKIRTSAAPKFAIGALWLVGPIKYFAGLLLAHLMMSAALFGPLDLIRLITFALIALLWTAYVLRSVRVSNTYGWP